MTALVLTLSVLAIQPTPIPFATPSAIIDAAAAGQKILAIALGVHFLFQILKSSAWISAKIPPRLRPWIVLVLSQVGSSLDSIVNGTPWMQAVMIGLLSAAGAIATQETIFNGALNGLELRNLISIFTGGGTGGTGGSNAGGGASTTAKTEPPSTPSAQRTWLAVGLSSCFFFAFVPVLVAACQDVKAAQPALDLANAECTQLDEQAEPDWLRFTCKGVEVVDNTTKVFTLRVPKSQGASFAAAHSPPAKK